MHFQALAALGFGTLAYAQGNGTRQTTLNWQACPELNARISALIELPSNFDCATLTVPLDYTNPDLAELQLSLFKVNATRQPAAGSILINFGGPGGTGAENLPAFATEIANNVGDQWDLVTWDPRGTGETIPFDCRITPGFGVPNATTTQQRKRDIGQLPETNLTDYFINYGWENAGDTADACFDAMNETGRYIGTAATARDAMSIVDALGEDGMLRYYGWSYGTALGAYLASMFPDRVERMVLDGNVNPHDYQAGHYGGFVKDADKAFDGFLQECVNYRENCPLAQYLNATTTAPIFDTINAILEPIAANASSSNEAFTIYAAVYGTLFSPLYYPRLFPQLADQITSIVNGSIDLAALLTGAAPTDTNTTNSTIPAVEPYNRGRNWATIGIRASDALFQPDTLEAYLPQVEFQQTVSSFLQGYPRLWDSARWRLPAVEQYEGNFTVTTRHPILFVNGDYDPVTPLSSAYNSSAGFAQSRVVAHNGFGHGIFVSPSTCVANYIQAYYADGTLPVENTRCERDFTPFRDSSTGGGSGGSDNGTSTTPPPGSTNTTVPSQTNPPTPTYTGSASRAHVSTLLVLVMAAVSFSIL